MDTLRIIEFWAAAAWADGEVHAAEAAAIERLVNASPELTRGERERAFAMLASPPSVSVDAVTKLDRITRQGIYRAVLGIAQLDGVLHEQERAFISRLRAALELDEATLTAIEAECGVSLPSA